jgi:hypothetical protein
LKVFLGVWVHVTEQLTYSSNGKYSVILKRLSDSQTLLSYSRQNIDLWRERTTFVRPKWGIYRSLKGDAGSLRNEIVLYDQFCLAKGKVDKCTWAIIYGHVCKNNPFRRLSLLQISIKLFFSQSVSNLCYYHKSIIN